MAHKEKRFEKDDRVVCLKACYDENDDGSHNWAQVGDIGFVRWDPEFHDSQGWTYTVVYPSGCAAVYEDSDVDQIEKAPPQSEGTKR